MYTVICFDQHVESSGLPWRIDSRHKRVPARVRVQVRRSCQQPLLWNQTVWMPPRPLPKSLLLLRLTLLLEPNQRLNRPQRHLLVRARANDAHHSL